MKPTARAWAMEVLPIAAPTLLLFAVAVAGIYAKVGHAAVPLDDTFIHFQYARAFATLHPFRYEPQEPLTTGATSFLWPALLAPFYALGVHDVAIAWPAWILSFLALGLLAREARHLTLPLAGEAAAAGAAAMVLAFSAFAWCAASGMEVVPFAWILARAARKASEWSESPSSPTRRKRAELLALAVLAPLLRPEGAIASWMIAATLLVFPFGRAPAPGDGKRASPVWALAAAAAAFLPFALGYALTGELRGSTAVVKLLPGNPYYHGSMLRAAIVQNVKLLLGTILNGEAWSAEFVPKGGAGFALAGLIAIGARGWLAQVRWRSACVLGLALGMLIPCAYVTFLWNRLRYLWPFATGWIIGLACLARLLGDVLGRVRSRWRVVTPIVCGGFCGLFLGKMGWTLDDVAESASGIDRQQVLLGRWAKENLPAGARIGVNDTGAIAYLSDRHTFDVVGLTTRDEGRYWVAGAASRFEHYERIRARDPGSLPTHFIVYPEWMACDAVLGDPLYEATVTDATILGGTTMRVYEADYSRLGSGELPWTSTGKIVDAVDVADLDSEAQHSYELLGTVDGQEVLREGVSPDGKIVVDGGRGARRAERMRLETGGRPCRGVVRLEAAEPTDVEVVLDGTRVTTLQAPVGEWGERVFELPETPGARPVFELRSTGGAFTVYHYWIAEDS